MSYGDGWTMSDVEMLYENRDIYDGWSAALLKDGRVVNRWPGDDRRFEPTEKYIDSIFEYLEGMFKLNE